MHKIIYVLAAVLLVSCASAPKSAGNSGAAAPGKEPAWVSNPHSVYAETQYVSAVGYGADRDSADKSALGALVSVFGQTVKGETSISSRYTEAVKSGAVQITENSDVDRAIKTSFDLDTVVGAEIKDTWFDGKKTMYAVAVMDKMKASILYAGLLESNEATIAKLIAIPDAEKNTLDAYARYDLAATIGDTNGRFLNILSVINPAAAAAKRGSVHNGDDLRLEVLRIAQNIPIAVNVANDRDGRIQAAFASVIAGAGFKTGGADSRYVLDGKLTLSNVELPNNPNKFVRYLVDAQLTDTLKKTVLLPYSVSGREGHSSVSEAENRAIRAAEQKIKEDYSKNFSLYLTQLTTK
jgi:hypothetical protein